MDALNDIVCTWKDPNTIKDDELFWPAAHYIETEDLVSVLQKVLPLSWMKSVINMLQRKARPSVK